MKIFVVGLGQVGTTVVEALHADHDVTVIDLDRARLTALASRLDLTPAEGSATSRRALKEAGVESANLFIACTSRDETNIVAATFAKQLSPEITTVVRTTREEYVEIWRAGELDIDHIVSSELETAYAVSRLVGVPAARQTDVFADGQVQMVEFDVEQEPNGLVGRPLREAQIPGDSKVASIIRGARTIVPRGDESIQPGDRIVVIGSPEAAREWSQLMAAGARPVDDVVVVGAGETGLAIARLILAQHIPVRLVEADAERARFVAEALPEARVFHATGLDPEFLEQERIGQTGAAVYAMPDDAKNLYGATLAKLHGVSFSVAVVHELGSADVFERAGVDVAVNPRTVTAEEIVRFSHDPRVRQLAMLEGDRFEILDITIRAESPLSGTKFRDLPMTGSLIGALVRDGQAIFPHGEDVLQAGDRAIIFTESSRVPQVERAL